MANKEPSKLSRKIDVFCRVVFLTEDGKPKSSSFFYSFMLGLLFLLVYIAVFAFMPDFQKLIPSLPSTVIYIMELILISVVGTIPCLCFLFLIRKQRNLVPAGFVWFAALVILMFIGMLFVCDWQDGITDYLLFLYILGAPMALCACVGVVSSHFIYKKIKSEEQQKNASVPKRPSYYDT